MRSILRLLDANANRAREAARVMEDAARFLLDDKKLAKELKGLRHEITQTMGLLSASTPGLLWERDTPRDVGTSLTTKGERTRGSIMHVVITNGKRLSEALRNLEEYGKLRCPESAARFKQTRYRAYDLEARLRLAMGSLLRRQWRLCVIVSESLCVHHDVFNIARAAVENGADCLQIREKDLDDRELLLRADKITNLTFPGKRTAHWTIVNDRTDIARVAAVGVHLGQDDLPPDRVRRAMGPDFIIGVSTHNMGEAKRAVDAGADYCGVGAIFPTTTKQRKPSGIAYLKKFIARYPHMPHLAIGGITPENVQQVIDAGARGIAVSSVVCSAKDPGKVVRKLCRLLPRSTNPELPEQV